jgi:glycosyltransferase involved in cell wall biosynthesis
MRDNKLRVVFILPSLTAGGAERVLITLMNGLDRQKFEPVFVTVSAEGNLRPLIDQSIPFHDLNASRVLLSLPALYRKLKKIKPDIVVTTMAHMNFVTLLLRPLFPKTRFIVREAVTPTFILDEHPILKPFLKIAYRKLYSSAARVISPSQIIIDEFKSDFAMKCDNHVLLRNPVNLDLIRAQESTGLPITPERSRTVHFVASGRLHHQKGFDRLIEALPRLKSNHDWKLTILGEGPERENLEALILKHNLKDKVSLPGHSNTPWPEYAQADCFVMPSRSEGLPNVVLESLACGTPVIATQESGGIAEIAALAETGSVTVVKSMDDFIHAMAQVKPDAASAFRPSLLPREFFKETIQGEFGALLQAA